MIHDMNMRLNEFKEREMNKVRFFFEEFKQFFSFSLQEKRGKAVFLISSCVKRLERLAT